jgi:hypothetical protein
MSTFQRFQKKDILKYFATLVLLVLVILGLSMLKDFPNYLTSHFLTEVEKIESIRKSCGNLCDTSRPGIPGPYFNHVKIPINCKPIFQNPYIDEVNTFKVAPREIPSELWNYFTMGNRLEVFPWYFSQIYLGFKARTPVWTREMIDNITMASPRGSFHGSYDVFETHAFRDGIDHAPGIKNGRVLVIGSEYPWVEGMVLKKGANEVITLEYGGVISKHPKVKTMIPSVFRERFLNGSLGLFDAVVAYSSIEHSGLGRYGDRLNPWGDIIAIARAWCVTKVHGSLTIGVPYTSGDDNIQYNAHRVYGKIRYPYLCANWRQHYRGSGEQRVFVFTKVDPQL